MVLISEWIFEVKGLKDCSIVVLDDKREIIGVIGILLMGLLLLF